MTPMSRLFRRLSFRKKTSLAASSKVSNQNSCPELNLKDSFSNGKSTLSDEMVFRILDNIDNPFELVRMRAVNKAFCTYVDQRFAQITEMDARRMPFDQLSISSTSCGSEYSCSSTSDSIFLNQQTWYLHPLGYKILMRFEKPNRVEIIADHSWNSKEIIVLCGAMSMFRKNVRHISLDAPIIELIIASLSLIDLNRWYAFQCFVQAVNEQQLHLRLSQPLSASNEKSGQNEKPSFYWPNAEVIIIRATKASSIHLARLLDYGVRSQLVMDRQKVEGLKIVLTDVTNDSDKKNSVLNRNLYHFRCWIGSAGFDGRLQELYNLNAISTI